MKTKYGLFVADSIGTQSSSVLVKEFDLFELAESARMIAIGKQDSDDESFYFVARV